MRDRNRDTQEQMASTAGPPRRAETGAPDVAPLAATLGLSLEGGSQPTAVVEADRLLTVAQALKQAGFMLMDVVGVDYSKYVEARPQRFAVLYNTYNVEDHRRLFLRVWLALDQEVPSLFPIWRAANYLEREVYDLMGVRFTNHPDLRKVLTPEDLEGHPLRKDFPTGETPTQFRDGRFLDPAAFRAGLTGQSQGLSGYRGALRRGQGTEPLPPVMPEGGPK